MQKLQNILLLKIFALLPSTKSSLDLVDLEPARVIYDAGDLFDFVYFPEDCVLSLLTVLADGVQIETATIGREGAFGTLASMGHPMATGRCMVQVGGRASRIAVTWLREQCDSHPVLRDLLIRYTQMTLAQVQQSAACNALHSVEARLARWLLEMSDRGGTERLDLTHEFLAGMLGANRATVSVAAASLQLAGCIGYRRGTINIRDRSGLEAACCECYGTVRRHAMMIEHGQ